MKKVLTAVLLRGVRNPIVRSALVNLEVAVAISVGTVVAAQAGSGHIDMKIIVGAVTAAFLKWLHSLATTVVDAATSDHPVVAAAQTIVAGDTPPTP